MEALCQLSYSPEACSNDIDADGRITTAFVGSVGIFGSPYADSGASGCQGIVGTSV